MGEIRMNGARFNDQTNTGSCSRDCGAMMKKLRMIDFALADMNLYLDAYPNSASALEYYHKLIAERERLAVSINSGCTPLTVRDNVSTTDWKWTDGPWPWQNEAN